MTSTEQTRPCGLRERKKARTRAAIREHALRLFRDQGYQATTVEQIAAAAEVSPSTFFRYFPTKEDVVLQDDFDDRLFECLERQPPSLRPVAALRAAMREAMGSLTEQEWSDFRDLNALAATVPEIRARVLDELTRMIARVAGVLARRTGRSAGDVEVRAQAGAIVGAIIAMIGPEIYDEGNFGPAMFGQVDKALAVLEDTLSF